MKNKYIIFITIVVLSGVLIWGLMKKSNFQDLNNIDNTMGYFRVAMLEESLVSAQVERMEKQLENDSNLILAVECVDNLKFGFHNVTQDVVVKNIYKGDEVREGDILQIVKGGSEIYITSINAKKKPQMNMGFVNNMIKGNAYLVFLNGKIKNTENLYITSDYIIAPIFSYNKIDNISDEEMNTSVIDYICVKDNEFFFRTEAAYKKMSMLKEKLLKKYVIEEN